MTKIAEVIYTKMIAVLECPYCSRKMYVNLGDITDMSEDDTEAVKCPYSNCGMVSWIDDEPIINKDIDDADIEEGKILYD